MKVTKDKVVSMHYTLKNDAGDVIDSSEGKETMDFLQGHGNIIPGLEIALEGSKKGDKVEVSIELQSQDQDGNPFVVTVIKLDDEKITVDANHPLAGETLHFSVSIEDIREALEEEISHGHAHSAGGHSH